MKLTKKDFYGFLTENACYNGFIINWRQSYHESNKGLDRWIEQSLDEYPEGLIARAFAWCTTEEGESFWEKINDAWKKKIKDVEKTSYPTFKYIKEKKILWKVTSETELSPKDIEFIKEEMLRDYSETRNYDISSKSVTGWVFEKTVNKEPSE